MTDAEVICTEVLEILAAHDGGLTARSIYEESRIAMSLQEITGALNRLRNSGKVQRGSDKCWRAMNAAERQRANGQQAVKAAAEAVAAKRQAEPKPEPERITRDGAIEACKKAAKLPDPPPKKLRHWHDDPAYQAYDPNWLMRELEQEAEAAVIRLDRYVAAMGDEVLEHLIEMCMCAEKALKALRAAHGE